MSTVRWHPRGESERRRLRGSGYKFGVTGGWKSMQEIYELIRREMIDGRRETRTQCIMLQERGAPWSAKAGANDSDLSGEMIMERWVESGLSKRVCQPRHSGARSTSREGPMVEEFTKTVQLASPSVKFRTE